MPTLVWSYLPQETMLEGLTTQVQVVEPSPQSAIVGWLVTTAFRSARVHYTITDTPQANSMAVFVSSVMGPFYAFQWESPNGGTYTVRFDSGISLEMFQPGLLRTAEFGLVVVNS